MIESTVIRAVRSAVTDKYSLFPLTPPLSPRERENCRPPVRKAGAFGIIARLASVPPLPEGEGRGEGEENV
jgi:hypothetical protein